LGIELAIEAEARKILTAIYEIRKNETQIDHLEIVKCEYCLAMVNFIAKNYENVKKKEVLNFISWNYF
jgi:hypothetical protein